MIEYKNRINFYYKRSIELILFLARNFAKHELKQVYLCFRKHFTITEG